MPCSAVSFGCFNCSSDGLDCFNCNETQNFFLAATNTSNNGSVLGVHDLCVLCTLEQCLVCDSLENCSQCNTTNNYFLNLTTLLCEPCTLQGCLECTSLTDCLSCDLNGSYYFANSSDSHCTFCDPVLNTFVNMSSSYC